MNIEIVKHQKLVNAVNARELHSFLEVGKDFSTWIKDRIEQYGFVKNQDFILIPQNRGIKNGRGGDRKSIEYHITLNMAKELSMVERNAKGKEARRYFIQCEEELWELKIKQHATAPHIDAMRKLLLLDSPSEWVKRFPDEFYIAIMKLHHHEFDGNKSTPSYCANITRRWIYNVIMPPELMAIIDENKRTEKIHQWLTTDEGQQRLSQQIGKVTMIAMMCGSRSEFDLKCAVMFLGVPLQLNCL